MQRASIERKLRREKRLLRKWIKMLPSNPRPDDEYKLKKARATVMEPIEYDDGEDSQEW